MAEIAIRFREVSLVPPGGRPILDSVSLEIEACRVTALLGRSGSGKTTLLRTVNGLVTPTKGEVFVAGSAVNRAEIIPFRRRIGYVIQESGLFPHMTVARNVAMSAELTGAEADASAARVNELLGLVGLDPAGVRDRFPWQLSGGQRQRVGVARALMTDPPVLLLDEPFGALDPVTRAEIQTMLRDLQRQRPRTVLLVTHDLEEALYLADRCVFLDGGCVVADLPVAEVERSETEVVRRYVAAARHERPGMERRA